MGSLHDTSKDIIITSWNKNITGVPVFVLNSKLIFLKNHLSTWNNEIFGNINSYVNDVHERLNEIQRKT